MSEPRFLRGLIYEGGQHHVIRTGKGDTMTVSRGTVHLGGVITSRRDNQYIPDMFTMTVSEKNTARFSGLQFFPIPGYDDLEDYDKGKVQLWDDTREAVKARFTKRRKVSQIA